MPFDLSRESWVEGAECDGCVALERCPDTQRFLALLETLDEPASDAADQPDLQSARGLFRWEDDVFVSRAPGRLDVMGGIADYSGSLVLQMPLAEACHVALQRHPPDEQPPVVRVVSLFNGSGPEERDPAFEMPLAQLTGSDGQPLSYAGAQALFKREPRLGWVAYVVGALVVLAREAGARFDRGMSILLASDVPEGKGVSSSAAIEVATAAAVAAAHGLALGARQLALLCQTVENRVVGAPCGVMDQMAATLGERGRLLALRCQPAEVEGSAAIPDHLQFWGVDSGQRHFVGGSDYGAVRTGAFMGLRIASQLAAEDAGKENGDVAPIGGGYLANVPPSTFAARYEQRLPEVLEGAAFLQRYGAHWDAATKVDPQQSYAVRVPAAHPIHENFRVHAFQQVLAAPASDGQLEVLGELMRQSHASYSRCGLGSGGTDRLVALVQEERDAAAARGAPPGVFGAKITGGGSGGTVCILAAAGQRGEEAVARVVQRYAAEAAFTPKVFRGSSQGAAAFGALRLRLRREGLQ